eukprot:scaffold1960_cov332-Prasinococcus_capsulatus_cf.AAC.2
MRDLPLHPREHGARAQLAHAHPRAAPLRRAAGRLAGRTERRGTPRRAAAASQQPAGARAPALVQRASSSSFGPALAGVRADGWMTARDGRVARLTERAARRRACRATPRRRS